MASIWSVVLVLFRFIDIKKCWFFANMQSGAQQSIITAGCSQQRFTKKQDDESKSIPIIFESIFKSNLNRPVWPFWTVQFDNMVLSAFNHCDRSVSNDYHFLLTHVIDFFKTATIAPVHFTDRSVWRPPIWDLESRT